MLSAATNFDDFASKLQTVQPYHQNMRQKYANNLFLMFLDKSCVFSKTANRATISSEYEAKQSKMKMETKRGQKRNQLYAEAANM